MPLVIKQITTEEELQAAFALRLRVFVEEHGFPRDEQIDEREREPTTIHFIGKDTESDEYVATLRCLLSEEDRKCKIGRVAVLAECRGKNYGREMMQVAEEAMKDKCDTFALSAVVARAGFYEKCGYERQDEITYMECGVPHAMMSKLA